jgi:hypothetical protein
VRGDKIKQTYLVKCNMSLNILNVRLWSGVIPGSIRDLLIGHRDGIVCSLPMLFLREINRYAEQEATYPLYRHVVFVFVSLKNSRLRASGGK